MVLLVSKSPHRKGPTLNLSDAASLARDLMDEHLIGWEFEFSNRKGALGDCSYSRMTIRMSREFVKHASESEIRNTMLHEIAHAMVGPGHNHDSVWRRKHISLGGNGSRTGNMTVSSYLYTGVCACGANYFKAHRLGSTLRNGTHTCGGSVTWTNTRTGEMTYRGAVVYSVVTTKSSVYA
jgi:predicted SprT family Zn-dependent metalloprotease